MTGFASIPVELFDRPHKLEVRTLNHRFLDVKLKIPRSLQVLEMKIRKEVKKALQRGSVELRLEAATETKLPTVPTVNENALRTYVKMAQEISPQLGLQAPRELHHYWSLPEVFSREGSPAPSPKELEDLWSQVLQPKLQELLQCLIQDRRREGQALAEILLQACLECRNDHQALLQKRAALQVQLKEKTQDRIQRSLDELGTLTQTEDTSLQWRVAQEIALLLDRSDVEEELQRLNEHLDEFSSILKDSGPHGRKLEFLLQELGREINTLGTKSADSEVSHKVVNFKLRLEQMREQALNLE